MAGKLLLQSAFALAVFFSVSGFGAAFAEDKPLVTIRFNSDAVAYEQPLERAVKMAQQIKPDASFEVVAIVPETHNGKYNQQFDSDARFHAEKITDQLKQSGVGEGMVHTIFQKDKFVRNNEIRIFVR